MNAMLKVIKRILLLACILLSMSLAALAQSDRAQQYLREAQRYNEQAEQYEREAQRLTEEAEKYTRQANKYAEEKDLRR